jgi:hypothetical protein
MYVNITITVFYIFHEFVYRVGYFHYIIQINFKKLKPFYKRF